MTVLRRVSFAATTLAVLSAFGLALAGIASTEGTLRPDGEAAALAAKQRATASASARHRECRRERDRAAARGESGRV